MDYKKIIKSKQLRLKILKVLDFVPDRLMIKLQYRIKTDRKLDLNNPLRYTEKLQWYKLYYKDSLMEKCADKFFVRQYVKSKGLEYILNDLYGVYDNETQIKFDELPNQFVIKTTNGGGGNNIIICKDKNLFDKHSSRRLLNKWVMTKGKNGGREWIYYNLVPKIIVEKLLRRDKNNDLPDYKFFCFNGKVYCLYVMIDYAENHNNGKLGFYDTKFNKLPYRRLDYKAIDSQLEKPKNFEKMIKIAETLSEDFPHVRVDLYNIDGEIVFGELTFFTASGYVEFKPDKFDFLLGEQFKLPNIEYRR